MFDWGKGENNSDWLGPYKSGQLVKASKSWSTLKGSKKTIEIRIRAKDIYGNEGNWSDPLTIRIIKSKSYSNNMLQLFFERLFQRFYFL